MIPIYNLQSLALILSDISYFLMNDITIQLSKFRKHYF